MVAADATACPAGHPTVAVFLNWAPWPKAGRSLIRHALVLSRMAIFSRKKTKKRAKKSKLTKKQLAQRKYASSMRGLRKRAKKRTGGKGRVAKRSGATRLRRKLGLKSGKKR